MHGYAVAAWFAIFLVACFAFLQADASLPLSKRSQLETKAKLRKNWQDPEYRLPGDVLPSAYSIRLLPFIEEGNIDGHVDIFVDCVNDTDSITLNSLNITYDKGDITVSLHFSQKML